MRVVIAEDLVLLREGIASLLIDNGRGRRRRRQRRSAARRPRGAPPRPGDRRRPHAPDADGRGRPRRRRGTRRRPDAAILILSQYVEERYASDLLSSGARGVGYLLKDRVADVHDFVAAPPRVAAGGTVIDPEVVAQLLGRRQERPVDLSPRASRRCSP